MFCVYLWENLKLIIMRDSSKYSVDIVTEEGYAQSEFQFDTNSLKKAQAKFDEYVKNEAFPQETVLLWSRLKSDDDIELVKEVAGTLILQEEEF
jgi:hypothetical protein